MFAAYGDIVYVKIPPGKGCGFVQFVSRSSAEAAMAAMSGQVALLKSSMFSYHELWVCSVVEGVVYDAPWQGG